MNLSRRWLLDYVDINGISDKEFAEQTARMFDILLGDDLPERKRFIVEHGSEYIKDADI